MFDSGSEARNAPIKVMVGTSHTGYHGDQGRVGIRLGDGGCGRGVIGVGGRGISGEGQTTEIE